MLVSIVIPSFEQANFIQDCIESVLNQEQVQLEVLIFDSESQDGTGRILDQYRDRAAVYVEKDLGQAHAINKGLMKCNGDIIGYLNSDDVLLPRCLKAVVDYWRKHPETDLLYGNAHYIDIEGRTIGDYPTRRWDPARLWKECFICQPAAFWSRRALGKIGLLDRNLHCCMDYDYWLRIALSGGVVACIDEFLACSRDYPSTKTRRLRGMIFKEIFGLSLRRLGYIDASWISQWLGYLKYEKGGWLSGIVPPDGRIKERVARFGEALSYSYSKDIGQLEYDAREIV